mgnify:FL=1
MPNFNDEQAKDVFKRILYVGDSGEGKTGSLASLVGAGYKLRIIDMDNGIAPLRNFVANDYPNTTADISYMSFRDKFKASAAGPVISGRATAYLGALSALDKWEDGTNPAEWGEKYILVLDSLTQLGQAAYNFVAFTNPTIREPRQIYNFAQQHVEKVIATLSGENFRSHVIVISHIDRVEENGLVKGFVSSIGKALGPKLPRYFNTLVQATSKGTGKNHSRFIQTVPTGLLALKNPAPFRIEAEYPLSTGMADLFAAL